MPAPSNQTAGTAIDIASLPYSNTQVADFAGTTYDLWYKYTAISIDKVISVWGRGAATYNTKINVYSDAGITQVLGAGTADASAQFAPITGVTYYFQFLTNAGNPTPADFSIDIVRGPTSSFASGDLFINNDTYAGDIFSGTDELSFGVILSPVDGTVQNFIIPFVTGDQGDVLTAGELLFDDNFNDELVFYDSAFTVVITVTPPAGSVSRIRACRAGNVFYVLRKNAGGSDVYTYSAVGVIGGTSWTLLKGGSPVSVNGFAPNNAETILYYAQTTNNQAINRWDLIGDVQLSDLVAGVASHQIVEIFTLADDTILAIYQSATSNFIRRYDSTGATLNTYTFSTITNTLRLAPNDDDPVSFWVMEILSTTGLRRYHEVRTSDGVILTTFDGVVTVFGITENEPVGTFGSPSSCPIIVLRSGAAGTGTIIVNKIVDPVNSSTIVEVFDFAAGGGLSPATFDLLHGEQQVFGSLAAGTYSIVETVPTGWDVTYVVSNGSPNTAITVADGETVTVDVTNTKRGVIVVPKMADPASGVEVFQFEADSPLSPLTFSLLMDEEQYFLNLVPGTYAIREVSGANPNWSPLWLFSNASVSNEAIEVGPGEVVTAAVLNENHSQFSGLYQIVPGKTFDTYFSGPSGATEDAVRDWSANGPIIQDLE